MVKRFAFVITAAVLAGCGTTPTAPVTKQAPKPTVTTAELTVAADAGRVEIQVAGLATAARKLMATVSQVSSIKITLSGGPLTAARTQNVSAAALSSGKGTVAFDAVPNGTVSVAIEALDSTGAKIGEKATSATVQRGQTAVVAVALKLQDTHVASENGNLAFDLEVQDGTVVVDPIAPASPRPSSPVLQPTPTPAPGSLSVDDTQSTWYADGTIKFSGRVRNTSSSARAAKVTVTFTANGVFGPKVVDTQEIDLGTVSANSSKSFSATSAKSVKTLFGKGTADATVN